MGNFLWAIAHFFGGRALKAALNWVFDYPMYSAAIFFLGSVLGGVVMTLLSIPLNIAEIKTYDWVKKDVFAIERIKRRLEKWRHFWFLDEEDTWTRR